MWRFLRACFYYVTGRWSKATDILMGNKYVMSATYDAAIGKQQDRARTVKDAVAMIIANQESMKAQVQQLSAKVEKLEKSKTGAGIAAKQLVEKLKTQGLNADQIKQNGEYLQHMTAFQDAATKLAEAENSIAEKEAKVQEYQASIAKYKTELQHMQRNASSLKDEKQEAIAETAIAQTEESINSILAGIESDTTDKDLAAAREARQLAKARARVASELAGNDAAVAESNYEDLATKAVSSAEFDALVGLVDDKPEAIKEPAKLPE